VEVYRDRVRAREYLYADPPNGVLRLWRMDATGAYVEIALEANGRMRSAELKLEFGIDEMPFLRAYTPEGVMFLTHEEEAAQRQEEARLRLAAEARVVEEVRLRQEAEARAAEEARQREELEREIAALQARLGEREA
jgi:hypothetical protein